MVVVSPASTDREFSRSQRISGREVTSKQQKCSVPTTSSGRISHTQTQQSRQHSRRSQQPDMSTIRSFEVVTVGCFAAHSLKLNKGPSGAGLFQLRQLLGLRFQLLEVIRVLLRAFSTSKQLVPRPFFLLNKIVLLRLNTGIVLFQLDTRCSHQPH
jgi:hypothetical protein